MILIELILNCWTNWTCAKINFNYRFDVRTSEWELQWDCSLSRSFSFLCQRYWWGSVTNSIFVSLETLSSRNSFVFSCNIELWMLLKKYRIFWYSLYFERFKKFVPSYTNTDMSHFIVLIYWIGKLIILSSRLKDVGKWHVGYGCLRNKWRKQVYLPQCGQQETIILIWNIWRLLYALKTITHSSVQERSIM